MLRGSPTHVVIGIVSRKPQRLHKEGIPQQYSETLYTRENFKETYLWMQMSLAKGQGHSYDYPDQSVPRPINR